MPTLESPPNPVIPPPVPPPETAKLAAGRYGALDHSEIVHLLSTLDDEVARSRFRESIYISLFVCVALAWFAFYGPRVLFHQGRIVNVAEDRHKNELNYLEMPKSLERVPPKKTKVIADQNHVAQTPTPTPKPPTPEQLQAMQRAGHPAPPARPLPPTPQPQQPAPKPQQAQQPQQSPPPRPTQQANNNIPDAPRPSPSTGRPNFSTPSNPGEAIRDAADAAARDHGGGGDNGLNAPRLHPGLKSGTEILSDTMGVDFGPYLRRLHNIIQPSWEQLIPQECYSPINKDGNTVIRLTILPDGNIGDIHLEDSTHDRAIDKAAWGSIIGQGQLPPLPASFKGQNLQLRFTYVISHEGYAQR